MSNQHDDAASDLRSAQRDDRSDIRDNKSDERSAQRDDRADQRAATRSEIRDRERNSAYISDTISRYLGRVLGLLLIPMLGWGFSILTSMSTDMAVVKSQVSSIENMLSSLSTDLRSASVEGGVNRAKMEDMTRRLTWLEDRVPRSKPKE